MASEAVTMTASLYFSYSHLDAKWLDKLQAMLAPMVGGGLKVWSDEKKLSQGP